jgi:hypothetical protein
MQGSVCRAGAPIHVRSPACSVAVPTLATCPPPPPPPPRPPAPARWQAPPWPRPPPPPGHLHTVPQVALAMLKRSVRRRAGFSVDAVAPLDAVGKCFIPAQFGHALDDTFVARHHSERLFQAYAGDKNLVTFEGDHNSGGRGTRRTGREQRPRLGAWGCGGSTRCRMAEWAGAAGSLVGQQAASPHTDSPPTHPASRSFHARHDSALLHATCCPAPCAIPACRIRRAAHTRCPCAHIPSPTHLPPAPPHTPLTSASPRSPPRPLLRLLRRLPAPGSAGGGAGGALRPAGATRAGAAAPVRGKGKKGGGRQGVAVEHAYIA